MKKSFLFVVIFVAFLLGGGLTTQAEELRFEKTLSDHFHSIIGNRDRGDDDDARAFLIKGSSVSPVSSYTASVVIYLKPGESYTIESPNIPGQTIKGLIVSKNSEAPAEYVQFPYTINYDDLQGSNFKSSTSGKVYPYYSVELQIDKEVSTYYDSYDVYNYTSYSNESQTEVIRDISGIGVLPDYNVYVLPGERVPLINNYYSDQQLYGWFIATGSGTTNILQNELVNTPDWLPENSFPEIFVLYNEGPSDNSSLPEGYWEAWDFNKVPGVQERLDELEPELVETTEETTEDSGEVIYPEEEPQQETSSSGGFIIVGILGGIAVASGIAFLLVKARRS